MANGESKVMQFLSNNGGVISRSEVLAMGMSPATLARRLQTGHLVQVGKGLYVQPGVMESERTTLVAATHALDAVVSHHSAARLHRLEGIPPIVVSVTVPVRKSNRFGPVVVHQLTDLAEDEVLTIDGLPTTDPARTIVDLASVIPQQGIATALDHAVRADLTTYLDVSKRLESLARKGKPGVTLLRGVLKPRLEGFVVSDSALETRLFGLIDRGGLPRPDPQFRPPWLKPVSGRVDLAYPDHKLIIEGDSRRWHGTPEAFQADRHRDNLAQLAGWRVLRFTWDDITKRPTYVLDSISKALSVSPSYQI